MRPKATLPLRRLRAETIRARHGLEQSPCAALFRRATRNGTLLSQVRHRGEGLFPAFFPFGTRYGTGSDVRSEGPYSHDGFERS